METGKKDRKVHVVGTLGKTEEEAARVNDPKANDPKEYEKYVKKMTPTHNLWLQMIKAFITGGIICVLGQVILNVATNSFQLDKETAGSWCALLLILISILLTGLNIYPKIVKWGGRGSIGAYYRLCQFRCSASH